MSLCRSDKEKQQLSIEIDGLVTQVDAANKAKVIQRIHK